MLFGASFERYRAVENGSKIYYITLFEGLIPTVAIFCDQFSKKDRPKFNQVASALVTNPGVVEALYPINCIQAKGGYVARFTSVKGPWKIVETDLLTFVKDLWEEHGPIIAKSTATIDVCESNQGEIPFNFYALNPEHFSPDQVRLVDRLKELWRI